MLPRGIWDQVEDAQISCVPTGVLVDWVMDGAKLVLAAGEITLAHENTFAPDVAAEYADLCTALRVWHGSHRHKDLAKIDAAAERVRKGSAKEAYLSMELATRFARTAENSYNYADDNIGRSATYSIIVASLQAALHALASFRYIRDNPTARSTPKTTGYESTVVTEQIITLADRLYLSLDFATAEVAGCLLAETDIPLLDAIEVAATCRSDALDPGALRSIVLPFD